MTLVVLLTVLFMGDTSIAPLSGRVVEADAPRTGVPGATVWISELGRGAVTDEAGRFTIDRVPTGEVELDVRHVAYRDRRVTVQHEVGAEHEILLRGEIVSGQEVVVTATAGGAARYQPVQAYSAEELQRNAATGLGEMLDGAPGVAMRSFGPVPSRPVIRGLDGDRILVLENGERMGDLAETAADHALGLDMLALNRVEIVRGPASLLYGSSAIGGVINMFNEDAPRSWAAGTSGATMVHGASVNRLGAVSSRFVHGGERSAVAARFSARSASEMRTPAGLLPGTFNRAYSGAVGMATRTDASNMGISVASLASVYGLPESLDDPDESIEIRMRRTNLGAHGRWDRQGFFESVDLRLSASSYQHDEIEIELDGGMITEAVELAFDQRMLGGTITARHRVGLLAGGAVGVNVSARSMHVGGEEALTPDARSAGLAVFALEEIALSPAAMISGGLRIEHQRLQTRPNERYPDADGFRSATTLSSSVGVNIRPTQNIEMGMQLARAFRVPRLEELYSDAAHIGAGAYEIGNPHLRNEVSTGVDAFAVWSAGGASVEVSAFTNRIRDFVIYQPTGRIDEVSGLPIFVYEADTALLIGGEVRAITPVFGPLSIDVALDAVHGTRIGDDVEPLPFMPPLRARVAAVYDADLWRIGVTTRSAAPQRRVAPDEDPTDGYLLVGAEILRRFHGQQVHAVGLRFDNLTDRLYRDHLSRIEERDAPMPGRNINLMYRWIF